MAVNLTHTTVAVGTDAGNGEIRKAQWNEGHTLTAAANSVLARAAATGGAVSDVALSASQLLGRGSTGDVAAIGVSSDLSISGTTLGIGSSVATLTGAQALTNKTINGSSNTITNVSLSTGVTGFLPVGNGGTGATTLAANNVLLGNGTSALQAVAPGASGNVLTSNGTTWVSQAGGASLLGRTDAAFPGQTALGYRAGASVSGGVYNTFIGFDAGRVVVGGGFNTALGYFALNTTVSNNDNTAIGYIALSACVSARNTAVGSGAGAAVTSGQYETFLGYAAGTATTTGTFNTGVGATALWQNTTGSFNCAVGPEALYNNTTADGNTAVGYQSLRSNTIGTQNVAIGRVALNANISGTNNTAVGTRSMLFGTTPSNCVSIGVDTLYSTNSSRIVAIGNYAFGNNSGMSGADNVAVGHYSGGSVSSGQQNTLIGSYAARSGTNDLTTGSNNTVIGYNAATSSATISNTITLGNSSIATLRCQVTTITALSDARDKSNISELTAGLRFVQALRPVSFDWNMRDGGKVGVPDTGFIAQELLLAQEQSGEIIPGLVYDDNPDRLEAGYGKLIPVLVKAIQELSAELDSLRSEIRRSVQ